MIHEKPKSKISWQQLCVDYCSAFMTKRLNMYSKLGYMTHNAHTGKWQEKMVKVISKWTAVDGFSHVCFILRTSLCLPLARVCFPKTIYIRLARVASILQCSGEGDGPLKVHIFPKISSSPLSGRQQLVCAGHSLPLPLPLMNGPMEGPVSILNGFESVWILCVDGA